MRRLLRVSAGLACALALAPAPARAAQYTLAIIPQLEQRKLFENWRPIAAELERRTGHHFELITTLGTRQFEHEYLGGRFDFVYMNPYFLAKTAGTIGYVPLVRDRTLASGVLLVRKGGPYRTPRDLAGRLVAFPTPNAVGACMVMRSELKESFGVQVEPLFVKTMSNAALHVAKGLADAAGVSEKAYPLLDAALREKLEVVHRTRTLPPHAVAAHPRVPAPVREAVRAALLAFAGTTEGRAAFARVPMHEPVAATMGDYLVMAQMGLDAFYDPGSEE